MLSVGPVGDLLLVNQTTDGFQEVTGWGAGWTYPPNAHPRSVAVHNSGSFVVAWQSNDGSGWNAYARVFEADGTPRTDEFKVNSVVVGDEVPGPRGNPAGELLPAVAMDADGDFVVVFMGAGLGDDCGIFARLYNADGIPRGTEFRVNTTTRYIQENPAVAMDPAGNFIVTWDTRGKPPSGAFGTWSVQNTDVYAQRFDATGNKLGKEFKVASNQQLPEHQSSVAVDRAGNFVVVWAATDQPWLWNEDIKFQRYGANGAKLGTPVTVTTDGYAATVGMNADGSFVIVWAKSEGGIFAQQYDANGKPAGDLIPVDDSTPSYWHSAYPSVAIDGNGNFVVAWGNWDEYEAGNPRGTSNGVWARRYMAGGSPDGEAFLVNSVTQGGQDNPTVAMTPAGDFFVIAFSGNGPGDDQGVFAQRYAVDSGSQAAMASAVDLWMLDLAEQSARRKRSSEAEIDLVLAQYEPLA